MTEERQTEILPMSVRHRRLNLPAGLHYGNIPTIVTGNRIEPPISREYGNIAGRNAKLTIKLLVSSSVVAHFAIVFDTRVAASRAVLGTIGPHTDSDTKPVTVKIEVLSGRYIEYLKIRADVASIAVGSAPNNNM